MVHMVDLSTAGSALLIIALLAFFLALIIRGRFRIVNFYVGFASIFPLMFLLIFAFLYDDFSVKNVFLNSSTKLWYGYKISASWASHEGSILLWLGLLSCVSAAFIFTSTISDKNRQFVIIILSSIQILFISFILFTSNPFEGFSVMAHEGLGLNPMLQDIALIFHPPFLYLGNVTYVILFACGCMILWAPDELANIIKIAKKFSSFAMANLTIGISLGSWWAYRELGWGGFWFFDPVENISLMPWLVGICLHHFLILTIRNGKFLRSTILLCLINFPLIIFGTFLVRSGILSSVHSFAFSAERGIYIFSIFAIISILALILVTLRLKKLPVNSEKITFSEKLMAWGNVFWIIAVLVIIAAVIYPVYCQFILKIEVFIDPQYFVKIFIPLFAPIIILAAIVPNIQQGFDSKLLILFVVSCFLTCFIVYYLELGFISIVMCATSIYLILYSINYIIIESNLEFKFIETRKYALFFGHFGFGILVLAITLKTSLEKEINFVGKVGESVYNNSVTVKLEKIHSQEYEDYYKQSAIFRVDADNRGKFIKLTPENRLYKLEGVLSHKSYVYSFPCYDIYAVLNEVGKNGVVNAKIYYYPWMSFIWISSVLMAFGFLLIFFDRRKVKT